MELQGIAVSGSGRTSHAMTNGPSAKFYAQYFGALTPGTFNVELPAEYALTPDMILEHPDDGTQLLVQRCKVENLDAFLVCSANVQAKQGGQSKRILEIVAAYPLRRYLRLEDGSAVTIKVAEPAEPSNSKGRQ